MGTGTPGGAGDAAGPGRESGCGGWPRWSPPEDAKLDRRLPGGSRVEPGLLAVHAPLAPLHPDESAAGPPDTEILHGEAVEVLLRAARTCRVRLLADGYVGWVSATALGPSATPTHRVAAGGAQLYPIPELKVAPVARLPAPALVAVAEEVMAKGSSSPWGRTATGHFVPMALLAPLDRPERDFVAVADGWLGAPYLWGGRSADGLDCSALVQLALACAGQPAPRDSDMQAAWLGAPLPAGAALRRGDLVFWRGHVGIMADAGTLLHANAHHMAVVREPLAAATARIAAAGGGGVTVTKRLHAAPAPR